MVEKSLKVGWRQVKFGDVVRQCKEKADPETAGLERYVAGDHMDTDDLRLRRWGEIGSGYLGPAFHMRFKPGQVLYGSRRTYLRKVAVADFDGICANTTFVLEPKNPKYGKCALPLNCPAPSRGFWRWATLVLCRLQDADHGTGSMSVRFTNVPMRQDRSGASRSAVQLVRRAAFLGRVSRSRVSNT